MFNGDALTVTYGSGKEVLFTIVDEELAGSNHIGRINRVTALAYTRNQDGTMKDGLICTTIIGLGDGVIGVRSDLPELRGKTLNKDNMEYCTVELYE
jgi:hypothetical protein